MSERSIQDIFDDERNNNMIIEKIRQDLNNIKEKLEDKLNIYINEQKKLCEEKKSLMIDLIKEGKLKWIECEITKWENFVKNTGKFDIKYYKFYYQGVIQKKGYYEGYYHLTDEEFKHFNSFINDYFFYGFPLYYDKNILDSEETDSEKAFKEGIAYFETICW